VQPFEISDIAVRTGIQAWRDAGWTGAGRRVGVIDRGFGRLSDFEDMYGVTVQVALGDDKADYNAGSIIHGTQVLETIHGVAPGADLYACQYDTLDKFTLCIDWMINAGVNIINHSAGVPALPLDGQGRWARQVDRAAQAGILWVNAAGNFAQGYHPGMFTDRNLNRLHEFAGYAGEVEALGVAPIETGASGVVMLSWEDHNGIPANEIDLDLQIIDAETGVIITASQNTQAGYPGDEPLEYLAFNMNRSFAVQIIDVNGDAAGVHFALFVEFVQLPNGEEQRSIITPGDSPSALTVGALQGVDLAPYSSRGPLATGAIKPDLVAPGEVELRFGGKFVGTSVAAPIVAGAAALVWEENRDYRRQDVRAFLLSATQDDDQIAGNDTNFGHGRLYMPHPITISVPSSVMTYTPTNIATPSPASVSREYPCEASVIDSEARNLNVVRARASNNAPLVRPVTPNEQVVITSSTVVSGTIWYQITYRDSQSSGWVSIDYVIPSENCP
jgi:subtilisin family serine protease